MNKRSILSLVMALAFTGVIASKVSAQVINIQETGTGDQSSMSLTHFTSLGSGDYTLPQGGAWVGNLSSNNTADVSPSLSNFNGTGGGWAFVANQGGSPIGNIWLANTSSVSNPGILLGDPTIAYSVAFQNTTSTNQTFTLTLSIPINPSVTYIPSSVRATVAGSVVDGGGADGFTFTPALPGGLLQTATLTTGSGEVSANTDLTSGTLTSSLLGASQVIGPITTPGYNGYITGPSGTFTALTVNVGVTLSPGDFAALTGRVDVVNSSVVPEPNAMILLMSGGGAWMLTLWCRRALIPRV
jgi:hypothetical protein